MGDFGSFAAYLDNRMHGSGYNTRTLSRALVYHDAIGERHPTPEAVRRWLDGVIPRAELVLGIAQLFNDPAEEVLAFAGRRGVGQMSASDEDIDQLISEYRIALVRTPAHLRRIVNRAAVAAATAAATA